MIILEGEQLRQLQLIELEILIEIDRICRKNKICYSLTGGSLLGAIRHGGFIPWDDDADISMLRLEYIKFQKACKKDLNKEKFYFQDIENTEGYRWGYGKIRRKDTVFLRENQEDMPYEQGVFVDIFPRDSVPDGYIKSRIHVFFCFCMRKLMWSPIGKKMTVNRYKKILYIILSKIPEKTVKKLYKMLVEISNKKKCTKFVRTLTFPLPNNQRGYERRWYEKYAVVNFEGKNFMVESSYKEWMKSEFGDYMEMPPLKERKVHPVTKIKLINLEGQCK